MISFGCVALAYWFFSSASFCRKYSLAIFFNFFFSFFSFFFSFFLFFLSFFSFLFSSFLNFSSTFLEFLGSFDEWIVGDLDDFLRFGEGERSFDLGEYLGDREDLLLLGDGE